MDKKFKNNLVSKKKLVNWIEDFLAYDLEDLKDEVDKLNFQKKNEFWDKLLVFIQIY